MHTKNNTQYKTLDRIAADPRVSSIDQEGPTDIWVYLMPGYGDPYSGTSAIHVFDTSAPVKDTVSRWQAFVAEEARDKTIQFTRDEWNIVASYIRGHDYPVYNGFGGDLRTSALDELTVAILQHVPINEHEDQAHAIWMRACDMVGPPAHGNTIRGTAVEGVSSDAKLIRAFNLRDDLCRELLRHIVARNFYMRQVDEAYARGDIDCHRYGLALSHCMSIEHKLAEHHIHVNFERMD